MIMVRFIFVDTTLPDKIRPRMETLPVKGHFLSCRNDEKLDKNNKHFTHRCMYH